jgi:hypothetical protein
LLFSVDSSAAEIHVDPHVYNKTAQRWSTAVSTAEFDSTSWIFPTPTIESTDAKHKNGHRDTIMMVSETTVPEDITIVVWFHGLRGFSDKTFRRRIMPQLNAAASEENSFAIVIPEMPWSINTTTPTGRQKQVWRKSGSLSGFITNIKERLNDWAIEMHGKELETVRWVFVGHSAGGSALTSASQEGGLCEADPELVIWSDASYGNWLKSAWNGCLGKTGIDQHILARKGDKPYVRARQMIRHLYNKKIPHNIFFQVLRRQKWTHRKIGDNALDLARVFITGC